MPLLLLVPASLLAFLLRAEIVYPVYHGNDMVSHLPFIRTLLAAFRQGSLGLDAWYRQDSFGVPIFRTYQNLSHYLAAGLCRLFGTDDVALVAHALIVLSILLQPFVFHHAARRIGLSPRAALLAGWLAPVVSCYRVAGHELRSYLYAGYGLLPQAFGVLCFVMAFAAITATARNPRERTWRDGVECGMWCALTFLFHHFFGYMALLYFGAATALDLALLLHPLGDILRRAAAAAAVFLTACAYQLLSIWQDAPLMHRTIYSQSARWDGVGIARAIRELGVGQLLDFRRPPVLTALCALGLLVSLRPRASRGERAGGLLLALGIFFYAGRVSFPWIDGLPGASHLHLERFIGMVQIAAIFLAGLGADAIAKGIVRGWRARTLPARVPAGVAAGLLAFGIGTIWWQAIEVLRFDEKILRETSAIQRTLDRRVFTSADPVLRQGNLWAFTPRQKDIPVLGVTPYFSVGIELGYSQVSNAEQRLTYATEAVPRIDPGRPVMRRLFNVAALIAPTTLAMPPGMIEVHRNDGLATWVDPQTGLWGVIGIGATEIPADEPTYQKRIESWLSDPALTETRMPAYVPAEIARRWPTAVPTPSAAAVAAWGDVAKSQPLDGNRTRAVLEATAPGAHGILRVAYHPRWSIRVNGVGRPPRWVSPGLLAFELDAGRNEVVIEFPEDPLRGMLFALGGLTLLAAAVFIAVADRFRLAFPALEPQGA